MAQLYYYDYEKVCSAAKKVLKDEHNCDKLCVDLAQYNYESFHAAVDAVVFDTLYWEGELE